jgi:SAM-dependent methyltransferase
MQYGVDIAAQRADDVDKRMIDDVAARVARGHIPTVIDIGCGALGQARRLAEQGAAVTAVDIVDYTAQCEVINTALAGLPDTRPITFFNSDLLSWVGSAQLPAGTLVSLQRVLHYVPYADAYRVLEQLSRVPGAQIYVSLTGTTSAIASGYKALTVPLSERFDLLTPVHQATFSITAPLCIYTADEARELLRAIGWKIVWWRVSDFGNIKAIAHSRAERADML